MPKIAVVEDDRTLADLLRYNLNRDGFAVVTAADGNSGLDLIRREKPDAVIMDVMLPGIDGFEATRLLRRESHVPVLMLTARSDEIDKVLGLELGADDYLTKPFSMRELLARVKVMLRRDETAKREQGPVETSTIRSGEIELDPVRHVLLVSGAAVETTPKEFDLLQFLMTNKGQVFSREGLLDRVWGYDYPGDSRTVDVHIRWLRQKIEADPSHPKHLLTVRGFGYKFEE
ncbi:response regulator transcription factor [Dehalogenimonas etheniformans]|uniref:DNA-binding response regulator n=1 Tax=Dehalogenimonas etheniformans TaxID=1536648 RepID=A0A2P5P7Q5_9CHLR|nr:response regulator transcription factor [Dehalogenimonas etheniformans]PPD58338.1 DNA-binding response regulator [Dehalogenimonas etheniformans]QNT76912.1 response regulator transcription factor [Dehalogenimonas etheniformans]